jgi:hypothetical protein
MLWPPCVRCPRSQKNAATSMALRRLAFLKKMPWLPETTRHRLSASLTRSVCLYYKYLQSIIKGQVYYIFFKLDYQVFYKLLIYK